MNDGDDEYRNGDNDARRKECNGGDDEYSNGDNDERRKECNQIRSTK